MRERKPEKLSFVLLYFYLKVSESVLIERGRVSKCESVRLRKEEREREGERE